MTEVEIGADMHCMSCKSRVEKALSKLDGVSSFDADLREKKVIVEFDESQLDEDRLRRSIRSALSHGLSLD